MTLGEQLIHAHPLEMKMGCQERRKRVMLAVTPLSKGEIVPLLRFSSCVS